MPRRLANAKPFGRFQPVLPTMPSMPKRRFPGLAWRVRCFVEAPFVRSWSRRTTRAGTPLDFGLGQSGRWDSPSAGDSAGTVGGRTNSTGEWSRTASMTHARAGAVGDLAPLAELNPRRTPWRPEASTLLCAPRRRLPVAWLAGRSGRFYPRRAPTTKGKARSNALRGPGKAPAVATNRCHKFRGSSR
jgi:hypothetical protein